MLGDDEEGCERSEGDEEKRLVKVRRRQAATKMEPALIGDLNGDKGGSRRRQRKPTEAATLGAGGQYT